MKQSDPFYHTAAWKAARAERLRRDHGMCCMCMAEFEAGLRVRPRRATMVHHVRPITERPDLALDIDNMMSLCDMHHNREHPEKGGAAQPRPKPTPTGMRVIKV